MIRMSRARKLMKASTPVGSQRGFKCMDGGSCCITRVCRATRYRGVREIMRASTKEVNGVTVNDRHKATCHCGSVEIELELPDGLVNLRRCDCSLCRRRGAIAASVPLSGIRIVRGRDQLVLYQFNTKTAKHYFCKTCGIYTHHQRRSNPEQYGFNVACLEGINPLTLEGIPVIDGVDHPSDK